MNNWEETKKSRESGWKELCVCVLFLQRKLETLHHFPYDFSEDELIHS